MLNTNVGDMPLDIYSDYVGDSLGIDFFWEYIVPVFNVPTLLWQLDETRILGDGYGYHYHIYNPKSLIISASGGGEQYLMMTEMDFNRGNGLFFGYCYIELSEVNPEFQNILHTTGYGLFEFQNGH